MQTKVCPIILRDFPTSPHRQLEILLFRHPDHNIQFVKGTLEINEDPLMASVRELWEESGLKRSVDDFHFFKDFHFPKHQHIWKVYWAQIKEQRDQWAWQTIDDQGHQFDFFWCSLNQFQTRAVEWNMDQRFRVVINELVEYFHLNINCG